ncbi:DMT family transporter [Stappia sediminis]|uniref:DMT family transporter n=1 Tax=Stappia sediminis TaxID=2692190 RepID=UPI00137114AF|nr:DMT family transporter [Stappia sediminis]
MPRISPGSSAYLGLVLLFCLTWSSAFPIVKFSLAVSPPVLFLGLRFLLAAVLLLAWAWWRGDLAGLGRGCWGWLFVLGLLNQAGYNGMTWLGMGEVSSGLATIIISMNPILIAFAASLVLGEALTLRRFAGLLLGLIGVVIVVRGRMSGEGEDVGGIILVTLGLVSLVSGTVLFKRWTPRVSLPALVGGQSLAAGAALLATGLIIENPSQIVVGPNLWVALAYNVFVVSIGAFLLWFLLLRLGSAVSASALHFLMPPLGLLFGWALLGEPVLAQDLAGVIPIGIGIWLVTRAQPAVRTQETASSTA